MRVAALVPPHLAPALQRAIAEFHVSVEFNRDLRLFITSIESGPPDIILLDTDLAESHGDLIRFARSLKPALLVVGVVYYWSEREHALRDLADALLRKPPRVEDWVATLRRLGLPERRYARAGALKSSSITAW